MIDLHSHILNGIDDGSRTLEESIEILKEEVEFGVTDVVFTPHYIRDSKYNANNKTKEKLLNKLKAEIKKENININLYLGNEAYIDEGIPKLLTTDIKTMNNSKYILVELPLRHEYSMLDEVINELIINDLTPIIAHPERYSCYQGNYKFFADLIAMGCILQGNIGSLAGIYGKNDKKMLKNLLKRGMIAVIGTDVHHSDSSILKINVEKCLKKIVKDEKKVADLLYKNAEKVINNKDITE